METISNHRISIIIIALLILSWWGILDSLSIIVNTESIKDAAIIYGVARSINGVISVVQSAEISALVGSVHPGELLGPMVIPGYWNNDVATKKEFTEDGFWKSGDVGFKDEEGYIYILDRKKDIINRGGYNVYSSEIENLISLQNGVIEVAVIPHPDEILGEKIHVVIFKNDSLLVDQLKLICKTKLADYKQPDYWTVVKDYLPKNKNGKVMKKDLSKLYNLF